MIKIIATLILLLTLISCRQANYVLDYKRMKLFDKIAYQVSNEPLQNLEIVDSNIIESNEVNIWCELIETDKDSLRGTVWLIEV
jgi:hypothetical protein